MKKVLCFLVCITALKAAMAQEYLPKPCNSGAKPELIPFLKGNKYGFCDHGKKLVIPAVYDKVLPFGEAAEHHLKLYYPQPGEAFATIGKQVFFVDAKGKTKPAEGTDVPTDPVQMAELESETGFSSNYKTNGKEGFILEGDTVVPAIYEQVQRTDRGEYFVTLNGKTGVLDRDGKTWLVPAEYRKVMQMVLKGEGRGFKVMKGLRWGLYVENKVIFAADNQYLGEMGDWSFDWYQVEQGDGKWRLADAAGKTLGGLHDELGVYDADTDRMQVKDKDKWGFADSRGIVQVPCKYTSADAFNNGIAKVSDGVRSFYIDCTGTEYRSK